MTPRQEQKLIRRLKQRDEQAFRQLVTEYQQKIFHVVYRMIGDAQEAEDLSQEVFITVFKNIDSFRGESKFSTWMYRIAINHCKNRIKYLGRRARGQTQNLEDTSESALQEGHATGGLHRPDNMVLGRELEGVVQKAIAALSQEHRALIILRDIQHVSYEEIAAMTGLRPGTVKSRLHRARVALKEQMRLQYEDPT
jgi:RNA polymerase sigma-70 factor (ECF subfamily)